MKIIKQNGNLKHPIILYDKQELNSFREKIKIKYEKKSKKKKKKVKKSKKKVKKTKKAKLTDQYREKLSLHYLN